jgi:7-carboxy-7-deazaguanine synthase
MTVLLHTAGPAGQLITAECFGPTLQGEGPSAGMPATFIRLSRCNLACTWCDTPYTWDWNRFDPQHESTRRSIDELAAWAIGLPPPLTVITGGEPLLQQEPLAVLVRRLLEAGQKVEIETNGTQVPSSELLVHGLRFNVSPKLANTQLPGRLSGQRRIVPDALAAFADSGLATFKFVASAPSDLEEIAVLEERHGLAPIWVMPEGTTPELVLGRAGALAEQVIARGWSLSLRLHVLLWGDVRGR